MMNSNNATENKATEVVLNRLVNDRASSAEIQHLLQGYPTLEGKAAAIENYCDQNFCCTLAGQLQTEVVPKLIAGASFLEIASRFEKEYEEVCRRETAN